MECQESAKLCELRSRKLNYVPIPFRTIALLIQLLERGGSFSKLTPPHRFFSVILAGAKIYMSLILHWSKYLSAELPVARSGLREVPIVDSIRLYPHKLSPGYAQDMKRYVFYLVCSHANSNMRIRIDSGPLCCCGMLVP